MSDSNKIETFEEKFKEEVDIGIENCKAVEKAGHDDDYYVEAYINQLINFFNERYSNLETLKKNITLVEIIEIQTIITKLEIAIDKIGLEEKKRNLNANNNNLKEKLEELIVAYKNKTRSVKTIPTSEEIREIILMQNKGEFPVNFDLAKLFFYKNVSLINRMSESEKTGKIQELILNFIEAFDGDIGRFERVVIKKKPKENEVGFDVKDFDKAKNFLGELEIGKIFSIDNIENLKTRIENIHNFADNIFNTNKKIFAEEITQRKLKTMYENLKLNEDTDEKIINSVSKEISSIDINKINENINEINEELLKEEIKDKPQEKYTEILTKYFYLKIVEIYGLKHLKKEEKEELLKLLYCIASGKVKINRNTDNVKTVESSFKLFLKKYYKTNPGDKPEDKKIVNKDVININYLHALSNMVEGEYIDLGVLEDTEANSDENVEFLNRVQEVDTYRDPFKKIKYQKAINILDIEEDDDAKIYIICKDQSHYFVVVEIDEEIFIIDSIVDGRQTADMCYLLSLEAANIISKCLKQCKNKEEKKQFIKDLQKEKINNEKYKEFQRLFRNACEAMILGEKLEDKDLYNKGKALFESTVKKLPFYGRSQKIIQDIKNKISTESESETEHETETTTKPEPKKESKSEKPVKKEPKSEKSEKSEEKETKKEPKTEKPKTEELKKETKKTKQKDDELKQKENEFIQKVKEFSRGKKSGANIRKRVIKEIDEEGSKISDLERRKKISSKIAKIVREEYPGDLIGRINVIIEEETGSRGTFLVIMGIIKDSNKLEVSPARLGEFFNSTLNLLNRLDTEDYQRSRNLFLNCLIDKYIPKRLKKEDLTEEQKGELENFSKLLKEIKKNSPYKEVENREKKLTEGKLYQELLNRKEEVMRVKEKNQEEIMVGLRDEEKERLSYFCKTNYFDAELLIRSKKDITEKRNLLIELVDNISNTKDVEKVKGKFIKQVLESRKEVSSTEAELC